MDKKHLILIDGHHLLYRAYWAIPRTLKTRAGEQVNTVFGMASMIMNILKIDQPDALLFTFDEGDETFRHLENETYKDGRAETPDDFYVQIPRVLELINKFSFPSVSDTKYEADDFLCSYAIAAEKEDMRVTVVSGDRDLFQIANENIAIAIPHKGYQQTEYLHAEEVFSKYGIRPDQVVSYKGLCGDSSDNLPGVLGIGPKTAVELISKYDTLEEIYNNLSEIRPSVREKLEKDKDQAFFCERMAQLVGDIPLPVTLNDTFIKDVNADDVLNFLQEMEFAMLTRRFQALLDLPYGQSHFTASKFQAPIKEESGQLTMF